MKSIFSVLFIWLTPFFVAAQNDKKYEDSLVDELNKAANDTDRLEINRQLGFFHQDDDQSKALVYHEAQRVLAKKLNLKLWEADAYEQLAYCYTGLYKLPVAYQHYMQGLKIAEDPTTAVNGWGYENFSNSKSPDDARQSIIGMIHFELASFYNLTLSFQEAKSQTLQALKIGEKLNNKKIVSLTNRDLGIYYLNLNQLDSAFFYLNNALSVYTNSPYKKNMGNVLLYIGLYHERKQQYDAAQSAYNEALSITSDNASISLRGNLLTLKGRIYLTKGDLDSALICTLASIQFASSINDGVGKADNMLQLSKIYKSKKDFSTAYDYMEKEKIIRDSLNTNYVEKLMQFQTLDYDQKIQLQALERERELVRNQNKMYAMLAGLGVILLAALFLYRNNRQKQKANKVLAATLGSLKSTQSQLIQSEKMASLGELTAGIAHEIQNPLNFVNNFSEVNKELLVEMNEEIEKGNLEEVKAIAKDVTDNEEKINHHGKRADSIVKGMLQHSRSSNGTKEPTDINALADEYLRLAYHGLRAKDKTFNATIKTNFDETIGNINIIPQDMGRVILNLINNAFFVVDEKKKQIGDAFKPTVSVSTKKVSDKIEIKVADNGNGIPQKVLDKIFQPFFTTKPTGQGTGLGLSLSYDIVKAHGGDIQVNTNLNEGTAFTISLPL